MRKYVIYKATNSITGKSYIGFDSNWPRRKSVHKRKSENGPRQYFHSAIHKYGWDVFIWEILYILEDREFALEMEQHCIVLYNTYNNGYNLTLGGEGTMGRVVSEETKLKMAKSNTGKVRSDEVKERISLAKRGMVGPNTGKKFSEEHCRNISRVKLGWVPSEESRLSRSLLLKGRASPMKGKRHSAETKMKMSLSQKERREKEHGKSS